MGTISTIWWEAVSDDNTTISEANGAKYGDINRDRLSSFQLRDPAGALLLLDVDASRRGANLVYRRRTTQLVGGSKRVFYILGWISQGPILGVYGDTLQLFEVPRFELGHPLFYPPVPHPHEGERWTIGQ